MAAFLETLSVSVEIDERPLVTLTSVKFNLSDVERHVDVGVSLDGRHGGVTLHVVVVQTDLGPKQ